MKSLLHGSGVIVITLIFPFFLYTLAFPDELTIYSSEGIQKVKIPESAGQKKDDE